jgi:hypothetical protein
MLMPQAVMEYLGSHPVIKETQLVAFGQSLGGAVAIHTVHKFQDKVATIR